MSRRIVSPAFVLGAVWLTTAPALAEVGLAELARAGVALPDGGTRVVRAFGGERPSFVMPTVSASDARAQGLIPITAHLAVGAFSPLAWPHLASLSAASGASMATLRYPLLDLAGATIRLSEGQNDSGLGGEGTIVGIVDTGADASHPALRHVDGTTRISWLLAFGMQPRGVHPELEEAYGCTGEDPCAVYSASDLNDILQSSVLAGLPKDPIGHGTHITSLAAGADTAYPGVAPLADLIVVAAADVTGGVSDARILLGTKFVFDRARDAALPAVVNVSLGSSFGAHDGSSSLERGLRELSEGPGRAVVVAAGNSGDVYEGDGRYPDPWGVMTQVAVIPGATVKIPVITPDSPLKETVGSVFLWLATNAGDTLSVGFESDDGAKSELVSRGSTGGLNSSAFDDDDDYDVIVVNGVDGGLDADVGPTSAVVAIVGTWRTGRTFFVTLEGNASARAWVTGQGQAGSAANGIGPLVPRALVRGTVAVPASDPALIAVGSTKNHEEWVDFTGAVVAFEETPGTRNTFSAAGPNQLGELKPELVAPGGGVIGAMAREADPRTSLDFVSQFRGAGICPTSVECFVIDDEHALASGTSMSAPLVTGTVALLMQRDPNLTQEQAKRYLMAGAHAIPEAPLGSMVGTGELDVVGTLLAQEEDLAATYAAAVAEHSRVVWAADFIHPEVAQQGFLVLRDAEDRPAHLDQSAVEIRTRGPAAATISPEGAGLAQLTVVAEEGSVGQDVIVETVVDGQLIESATFRVERDAALATHGYEIVGGTCSFSSSARRDRAPAWALLLLLTGLGARLARRRWQRSSHAIRADRDQGRTDEPDPRRRGSSRPEGARPDQARGGPDPMRLRPVVGR